MSDDQQPKKDTTPFSSEEPEKKLDVRRTQVVKRPRNVDERANDASTLTFDKPTSQVKKEDHDSHRDTAVLSRDNPMLRRVISQHASASSEHENGISTLGETREVILLIRGMVERIVMQENKVYKLGRFELLAKGDDEIDLSPYGAQDRGVSRIHAQLHLSEDKLYITDLASTNGTYLSGARLAPNEATLLKKGDELLLGRLAVQVLFR